MRLAKGRTHDPCHTPATKTKHSAERKSWSCLTFTGGGQEGALRARASWQPFATRKRSIRRGGKRDVGERVSQGEGESCCSRAQRWPGALHHNAHCARIRCSAPFFSSFSKRTCCQSHVTASGVQCALYYYSHTHTHTHSVQPFLHPLTAGRENINAHTLHNNLNSKLKALKRVNCFHKSRSFYPNTGA